MPEAAIGAPERVASTVVTSENLAAFNAKRMDLFTPEPPKPSAAAPELPAGGAKPPAASSTEDVPTAKQSAQSAEPAEDVTKLEADLKAEEAKPEAQQDGKKKEGIRERLSVLTQKRKEAEAATAKERDRAERAERELAEERARRPAPPPAIDAGAEPQRAAFATDAEYLKAMIDHGVKRQLSEERKAQAEAQAKADQERVARTYAERLAAAKARIPDFDARIDARKDLPIPKHIGDAITESEHGPDVALYFADHPEEATRLGGLNVNAALREFGKIEAMIEAQAKPAPKAEAGKAVAEVSAAPPPISPLKGGTGAVEAKVDNEGRFTGTYAEYKAARKAGKIK